MQDQVNTTSARDKRVPWNKLAFGEDRKPVSPAQAA